jgi:AcrR family transcriptional regulator
MSDSNGTHSGKDTKERIIAAAERLFAERGFAGTSLRGVTSEAGVNLAAVHYHFGTKDALLQAVFGRRIGPVNRQRLQRLDELQRGAGGDSPEIEDILEAFLSPILDLKRDLEGEGLVWSRFIGRVYSEPLEIVENMIREQFEEVGQRFTGAFSAALPHLSQREIVERLQFAIGALSHTLIDLHRAALPDSEPRDTGPTMLQHMIVFLAAAFRAPSATTRKPPSTTRISQARAS